MANLYMIASTDEETRLEGSVNAVLAIGADEAAARAAVLAVKPNGSFDASKFAAWSAWLVAAGTSSRRLYATAIKSRASDASF